MWSHNLPNLKGAKVLREAHYVNPEAGATGEALTDRAGKQTSTVLEMEQMVRRDSCPENNNDLYNEQSPAGSAPTCVTIQAVEGSLHSQSVKKAPGSDKMSHRAIQLLGEWDIERIVRMTKVEIRTGRHPAV